MKKKFLTAMLLFAFLMVGIQNATAQYVSGPVAMTSLNEEITILRNNPIVNQKNTNHPQFSYLFQKFEVYAAVYEKIYEGAPVGTSIQEAIELYEADRDEHQPSSNGQDGVTTIGAIEQDLEDLLSL